MRPVQLAPAYPADDRGKIQWLIDRVTQLCTASQVDSPVDVAAENDSLYQPLDDDLTAIAALSTTAFGRALLALANEAAFKAALNLEANTDYYAPAGTDVALADGGTGASLVDPNADRILFWDDSAGTVTWLTPSTGLEINATDLRLTEAQRTRALIWEIDGGGSVITTGIKGDLYIPMACTIVAATLVGDVSGSIVVDIWKDARANAPPTVADTITAAAKPTLSAAVTSHDTTLTGWTTAIAAGDVLRFNVDSVGTVTKCTVTLTVLVT